MKFPIFLKKNKNNVGEKRSDCKIRRLEGLLSQIYYDNVIETNELVEECQHHYAT